MQRKASFGWVSRPAPLVNENGRSAPFHGVGPIPVGQQDQIIERIRPTQNLVAISMWFAHHEVIVGIRNIVRPKVRRANGNGPVRGAVHTIRAVEQANQAVHPFWGGAIAFFFSVR